MNKPIGMDKRKPLKHLIGIQLDQNDRHCHPVFIEMIYNFADVFTHVFHHDILVLFFMVLGFKCMRNSHEVWVGRAVFVKVFYYFDFTACEVWSFFYALYCQ